MSYHVGHCCVCVVREELVKKPSFIFPQKSGEFQLLLVGAVFRYAAMAFPFVAVEVCDVFIVAASLATHSEYL